LLCDQKLRTQARQPRDRCQQNSHAVPEPYTRPEGPEAP
jgi:hypothetical protein